MLLLLADGATANLGCTTTAFTLTALRRDVRSAIEAGEREPVQSLPWGQWREGYANYIIDHKDNEYIRLYPATFANLATPSVQWLLNGVPATYAQVEPYLLASEKRHDDDKPACFTINAENVLSIGE